jgi:hypothetical protein
MTFSLGLIHDAPAVRGSHTLFEIMGSAAAVAAYPPTADLRNLLQGEPILHQGNTGSCARHATARAIQVHARAQFDVAYPLPSARLLTYQTMTLLGPAWTPDGTTIGAVIEAAQTDGITPEGNCPWNPDWDADPKHIYFDQLQDGLEHRQLRAHRVMSSGDTRMDELCAAIAAGKGVVLGMDVDSTIFAHGEGVWAMTGGRIGGHAMAAVGYDEPGNILVCNSWGWQWGLGGFGYIARQHVADAGLTRSAWITDTVPKGI